MRISRIFALVATAAIGCAVQFGPGDYADVQRSERPDAGTDASSGDAHTGDENNGDDASTGDEDGRPKQHLFVYAAERDTEDDTDDPHTSDVWLATIDDSGEAKDWQRLQQGVFPGAFTTWSVDKGRVFVMTGEFVQHAPLGPSGLGGFWQVTRPVRPPAPGFSVLVGARLFTFEVEREDGRIWISQFVAEEGAFIPVVPPSMTVPFPMPWMRTVTYKDFVYFIDGNGPEPPNRVYVARVDPTVGIGPLTETERLADPAGLSTPHVLSATLCGVEFAPGQGRLIYASQQLVVTSAIDEETGMLGPWERAPMLPGRLTDAGCVFYGGHVHLLGGLGASSRTDRILRARFGPDGKLSEWEISKERLPMPRSHIFAFVY